MTKDSLVVFLKALTDKWYTATRDIAELARSVKQKLSQPGVEPITEDEFKSQLMHHCGVLKKLQELQEEALQEHGHNAREVEIAQEAYSDDPTVKIYSDGFQSMLDDCLKGVTPIMPNTTIPKALTEEKVLEMLAEIQNVEIKKVCEHFEESGGYLPSVQALGNVLALANKEAEQDVQQRNSVDANLFHSTVATYQRNGGTFAGRKAKLDAIHRDRMVKMFKPAPVKPEGGKPEAAPVPTVA